MVYSFGRLKDQKLHNWSTPIGSGRDRIVVGAPPLQREQGRGETHGAGKGQSQRLARIDNRNSRPTPTAPVERLDAL